MTDAAAVKAAQSIQSGVNDVLIRGAVIRKFKSPKGDWLVLTVATTSHHEKRDYPTIYWYGEMVEIVDKAYGLGSRVTINARIQTSKQYRTQSIIGIDINDTPRELEEKFGESSGRYAEDKNEVLIKGELINMFTPEYSEGKLTIGTFKTVVEGHISFPQVSFFGFQRENAEKMHVGDTFCLIGHIQTKRKKKIKGEKSSFYQSIVCHYSKPVK